MLSLFTQTTGILSSGLGAAATGWFLFNSETRTKVEWSTEGITPRYHDDLYNINTVKLAFAETCPLDEREIKSWDKYEASRRWGEKTFTYKVKTLQPKTIIADLRQRIGKERTSPSNIAEFKSDMFELLHRLNPYTYENEIVEALKEMLKIQPKLISHFCESVRDDFSCSNLVTFDSEYLYFFDSIYFSKDKLNELMAKALYESGYIKEALSWMYSISNNSRCTARELFWFLLKRGEIYASLKVLSYGVQYTENINTGDNLLDRARAFPDKGALIAHCIKEMALVKLNSGDKEAFLRLLAIAAQKCYFDCFSSLLNLVIEKAREAGRQTFVWSSALRHMTRSSGKVPPGPEPQFSKILESTQKQWVSRFLELSKNDLYGAHDYTAVELFELGKEYFVAGDKKKAYLYFHTAAAEDRKGLPREELYSFRIAEFLRSKGSDKHEEFLKIAESRTVNAEAPEVKKSIEEGRNLFEKGNKQQAIELWEKVQRENPYRRYDVGLAMHLSGIRNRGTELMTEGARLDEVLIFEVASHMYSLGIREEGIDILLSVKNYNFRQFERTVKWLERHGVTGYKTDWYSAQALNAWRKMPAEDFITTISLFSTHIDHKYFILNSFDKYLNQGIAYLGSQIIENIEVRLRILEIFDILEAEVNGHSLRQTNSTSLGDVLRKGDPQIINDVLFSICVSLSFTEPEHVRRLTYPLYVAAEKLFLSGERKDGRKLLIAISQVLPYTKKISSFFLKERDLRGVLDMLQIDKNAFQNVDLKEELALRGPVEVEELQLSHQFRWKEIEFKCKDKDTINKLERVFQLDLPKIEKSDHSAVNLVLRFIEGYAQRNRDFSVNLLDENDREDWDGRAYYWPEQDQLIVLRDTEDPQFISILIQQFTHIALRETFNRAGRPHRIKNNKTYTSVIGKMKESVRAAVATSSKEESSAFNYALELLSNVFEYYDEEDQEIELILRYPQVVAAGWYDADIGVRELYSPLKTYWDYYVEELIESHLLHELSASETL